MKQNKTKCLEEHKQLLKALARTDMRWQIVTGYLEKCSNVFHCLMYVVNSTVSHWQCILFTHNLTMHRISLILNYIM